ncbi:MAG: SCO family protein [Pseudomonadota bacterium]
MERLAPRPAFGCGLLGLVLALGACNTTSEAAAPHRLAQATTSSLFAYPWRWTDESGRATAFSNFRGVPLIVTEIYTSCTSTCPRTVAQLRKLSDRLEREGKTAQFLLVTLDPSSDTPERLRRYKAEEALPASWHLLSGSKQATQELSDVLEIHVIDASSHLVHDAKIVLFDADGKRLGVLNASPSDNETLPL